MGAWGSGAFNDDAAKDRVEVALAGDVEAAAPNAVKTVSPGARIDYDTGAEWNAAQSGLTTRLARAEEG